MANKTFTRLYEEALRNKLQVVGFCSRRKDSGVFIRPMSDSWSAVLGMNRASYPGRVMLNPIIGVRNEKIEELRSFLMNRPYKFDSPSTYFVSLVLIGRNPSPNRWELLDSMGSSQVNLVLDDLIAELESVGIPFVHRNLKLNTILNKLEPSSPGFEFRYPVILAAMGRAADALAFAKEHINSFVGDNESSYAKEYIKFHESLSAYVVRHQDSALLRNPRDGT